MKRCLSCFRELDSKFDICPYCGQPDTTEPIQPIDLIPGTILNGRYLIGYKTDNGGFGIVYKAFDLKFETIVAVKELFVSQLMTRAVGTSEVIVPSKSSARLEYEYRKRRFLSEARTLAKFGTHQSIVNVFDYFEENNTAYIIMEYLDGISLSNYMKQSSAQIDIGTAVHITEEICCALKTLHKENIYHCDIAPDNIIISGNSIKVIDFGSASLPNKEEGVIDITLKPGFSPPEQYDSISKVGPWSDIYSLGATLYFMLTNVKPDESTNRKIEDTLVPPKEINSAIPDNLNNTIMKALALEKHLRFKSVEEFEEALNNNKRVLPIKVEKKRRKRRQILSVIAAALVLVIGISMIANLYVSGKKEARLSPADITLWASVEEGSTEENALREICSDFETKNKGIHIEVTVFPESEYEDAILNAFQNDSMPDIFESSNLPDEVLSKTISLDEVTRSPQIKECYFKDECADYSKKTNKLPIGIELPMAFVITSGPNEIKYEDSYYKTINDFNSANIAVQDDCKKLYAQICDDTSIELKSQDSFYNADTGECPVILSSNLHINEFREKMSDFMKAYVLPDTETVNCRFVYEWSISDGAKEKIAASNRLLSWMLGTPYQTILMISLCNDGQMPINKACFEEKCKSKSFENVKMIMDRFVFINN